MNTFTNGRQVLPPNERELSYVDKCIEKELARRARKTPPMEFEGSFPNQARYRAENKHNKYTWKEIDDHRMEIFDLNYWKREAEHFRDEFIKVTMDCLLVDQINNGVHPADAWRDTAFAFQRKLRRQGLSNQEIYHIRLGIEPDEYWDREVDLFERISLEHRYKFYRKLGNLPTWSTVDSEGLTLAAPYVRKQSPNRPVRPAKELRRSRRVQIANERKGSTTPTTRERSKTRRGKYKPRR